MALFNLSEKKGSSIGEIIGVNQNSGNILQGEKDMYQRIVKDCESSPLTWYMWYDKSLPIPIYGQQSIQIDFILLCEEGIILVEVKGGKIDINGSVYSYEYKGKLTPMRRSPFKQVSDYKYALINNGIFDGKKIFIDCVCAFPHSMIDKTNDVAALDEGDRLWNKADQDSTCSFADFCLDTIREDKRKERFYGACLTENQMKAAAEIISPTISDESRFTLAALEDVLDWLHIDNLDTLNGLRNNKRLVIEGGPGTGKTTMAKAFIKRHQGLHGLYLCWTVLLASKIKYDLERDTTLHCEVKTYNTYIKELTNGKVDVSACHNDTDFLLQLRKELSSSERASYDYIIIDEAQDVADLGLDIFLDTVLTPDHEDGLEYGRFLVFYDIEQGYNNEHRKLNQVIERISKYAGRYNLDDNKRVAPTCEIAKYANTFIGIEPSQENYGEYLRMLSAKEIIGIHTQRVAGARLAKKAIKAYANDLKAEFGTLSSTTLLVHSSLSKDKGGNFSFYSSLTDMLLIEELDAKTFAHPSTTTIAMTTILKYKGLENKNVILVIPGKKSEGTWDTFLFELYIGMTRAIMNLKIIVLDE